MNSTFQPPGFQLFLPNGREIPKGKSSVYPTIGWEKELKARPVTRSPHRECFILDGLWGHTRDVGRTHVSQAVTGFLLPLAVNIRHSGRLSSHNNCQEEESSNPLAAIIWRVTMLVTNKFPLFHRRDQH